jgi:predicted metal-dependent hydrolase
MTAPADPLRAVGQGVRLFNRGRYLAAQEVWETAWRDAPGEARSFLEGLVQLAAGLHLRTRRGATKGAEHLLAQAMVAFEDHRPASHGIDVDRLIADVTAYFEWLREVRRPHRFLDGLRLPRIHAA